MAQTDFRSRVTVLAGFSPAATEAVARSLLVTDPALVLIGHDLTGIDHGVILRTIRTAAAVVEEGRTELVHGCVSCTLREDIIPTLVRVAHEHPGAGILLALPPAVEPEAVAAAGAVASVDGTPVTDVVRFDSFVTVVEAASLLEDLTTTDELRDRGRHAAGNDRRTVAEVISRQVEFADTVAVWNHPDLDPGERDRVDALLYRLAPWATRVRVGDTAVVDCTALAAQLLGTGRYDPATPGLPHRAMEGYPIGLHDPHGDSSINALLFHSRRPFHPQRLHDRLDDIAAETIRGRGQLWLASQPDTAIGWESAGGGLTLGNLGPWLAALPDDRWDTVSDMRRLAADADWDPYYGDRRTVLSFVGINLDADALTTLLRESLVTDEELAAGTAIREQLPDPFGGLFPPDTDDARQRTAR